MPPWLPLCLLVMALAFVPVEAAKNRLGGWRLADASSPYLQMHADNPVEWHPWGEEAFARARAENKPLFISIGYFTCHWCHVMERESFRNPEIARLLNRDFVSIKVDREQHPDIDAAYMRFLVATQGYGGWPMTILAAPDGTPFFGGSYFPPEDRQGAPGFAPLLRKARALWAEDRRNVIEISRQAVAHLKQGMSAAPLVPLTNAPVDLARRQFRAQFDPHDGGFGLAPKFPQPAQLLFLLQDDDRHGVEMARYTLERMAAGGIHDQLEGGFHRYATDAAWRTPHFEKMLYDQALIARAFLAAYRRSGDEAYAVTARRTLDFVLEHMRDARGGFHAALGADSALGTASPPQTAEGAYYVWDWPQLRQAIPDLPLRQWAIVRYGLKPDGNVPEGSASDLAGKNVLYVARSEQELADQFGEDPATAHERIREVNRLLLSARRQRPAPPRDDKIVAAWNGYMITALAEAGKLLDEARYRRAAGETARFVLEQLYDPKRNLLYRDWRGGKRGVAGFAEDYAALAEGLLALHDFDRNKTWLAAARQLTDAQISRFWDADHGGFYAGGDAGLWLREKTAADHVTPSASAVAAGNLLQLAALTGDKRYLDKALRTAAWLGGMQRETPEMMPYMLLQWPRLLARAGGPGNGKTP